MNAVVDISECSFMQLHSLSTEHLNGRIVEVGEKVINDSICLYVDFT